MKQRVISGVVAVIATASLQACGSSAPSNASNDPATQASLPARASIPPSPDLSATASAAPSLVDFGADPSAWPQVTTAAPTQPQLAGIPADLQRALGQMWQKYATNGYCTPSSAAIGVGRWSNTGFALIDGSDCGVGGLAVLSAAGGTWHSIIVVQGQPPCSDLQRLAIPAEVWNGRGEPRPSCTVGGQLMAYPPTSSGGTWTTYETYRNARYHYRVDVPIALKGSVETSNHNGMKFMNADQSVAFDVYAQNNVSGDTLQALKARAESGFTASGGKVTYAPVLSDGFVVSGIDTNGNIYYERDFVFSHVEYGMSWAYPASMKTQLDAAVKHSFETFVPGPNQAR